jgi:hypothetical protein
MGGGIERIFPRQVPRLVLKAVVRDRASRVVRLEPLEE